MIPPRGFKAEVYPLRHRLIHSFGLTHGLETLNGAFLPLVMGSTDMAVNADSIQVNPHNTAYEEDTGPLCRQMSIIDKLSLSLKFNMTENCLDLRHTSGVSTSEVFTGDSVQAIKLLWRPIFGSFTEKLDAADDDTGQSVATILGLTHDSTFEDVVPLTTTKLSTTGQSDLSLPMSSVNDVQVFGDYNMTTNTTMEEHVWDEDLFQSALRRFTNKGALRSMVGRTRHFTLTRQRPFKNFFLDKFVPRAIRRIVPFSFLGIQIHIPFTTDIEQYYHASNLTSLPHVGVTAITNYHEWNSEHDQAMAPDI